MGPVAAFQQPRGDLVAVCERWQGEMAGSNFEELQRRLEAGETILMDGGMGSEFDRRGLASPTTWSGGPMLTHPELVRDIHQDYIEAGAEIIITVGFADGGVHLTGSGTSGPGPRQQLPAQQQWL